MITTAQLAHLDPGGVLPYIAYTGMCRPAGSGFWSWRFLERGIIFRTHENLQFSGALNESMDQNHLNIALLNVF